MGSIHMTANQAMAIFASSVSRRCVTHLRTTNTTANSAPAVKVAWRIQAHVFSCPGTGSAPVVTARKSSESIHDV
jgi:hypothetical protein